MSVVDDLVRELGRLPGIGKKTAQRLAYYLLKAPPEEAKRLARALERAVDEVRPCSVCGHLSGADPCEFCASNRRDVNQVCVVEESPDIAAIEKSGRYHGLYHVLGGRLSPLDGIGPDDLNIAPLMERLRGGVAEMIVATNPSVEGEATATYLHRLVADVPGLRVTRPARGLPVGGDLEYADGVTIAEAFTGRREM